MTTPRSSLWRPASSRRRATSLLRKTVMHSCFAAWPRESMTLDLIPRICNTLSKRRRGVRRTLGRALPKKLGRYLLFGPRLILRYDWQGRQAIIGGYTDSEWGRRTTSRRSASGAVIMTGNHVIQSYSWQQKVLALSNAEAEMYGIVACSAEVRGILACVIDMGLKFVGTIYADASAALGIVQRRGDGKARHIRTQSLCLQEAHAHKRLSFAKVDGSRNPSDAMSEHLNDTLKQRHLEYMNTTAEDG